MYVKIIVALTTIIGTMAVYISQIPVRENMMPGGELFIPFYMLLFWMIGHDVYKGRKVDE